MVAGPCRADKDVGRVGTEGKGDPQHHRMAADCRAAGSRAAGCTADCTAAGCAVDVDPAACCRN